MRKRTLPAKDYEDLIEKTSRLLKVNEGLVRLAVMHEFKYAKDFMANPSRGALKLPELGTFYLKKSGIIQFLKVMIARGRKRDLTAKDVELFRHLWPKRNLHKQYFDYKQRMSKSVSNAIRKQHQSSQDTQEHSSASVDGSTGAA